MRFVKDKLCLKFEKGKKTKSSFKPKQCSSITTPFSLLLMDLFGPIPVAYRAGKRYSFVSFHKYSCFTWVVFLRRMMSLMK